jgi:hypothetical protein
LHVAQRMKEKCLLAFVNHSREATVAPSNIYYTTYPPPRWDRNVYVKVTRFLPSRDWLRIKCALHANLQKSAWFEINLSIPWLTRILRKQKDYLHYHKNISKACNGNYLVELQFGKIITTANGDFKQVIPSPNSFLLYVTNEEIVYMIELPLSALNLRITKALLWDPEYVPMFTDFVDTISHLPATARVRALQTRADKSPIPFICHILKLRIPNNGAQNRGELCFYIPLLGPGYQRLLMIRGKSNKPRHPTDFERRYETRVARPLGEVIIYELESKYCGNDEEQVAILFLPKLQLEAWLAEVGGDKLLGFEINDTQPGESRLHWYPNHELYF